MTDRMTAEEMTELAHSYRLDCIKHCGEEPLADRLDAMAVRWHQAAALTRIADALERLVDKPTPFSAAEYEAHVRLFGDGR